MFIVQCNCCLCPFFSPDPILYIILCYIPGPIINSIPYRGCITYNVKCQIFCDLTKILAANFENYVMFIVTYFPFHFLFYVKISIVFSSAKAALISIPMYLIYQLLNSLLSLECCLYYHVAATLLSCDCL